MPLWTRNASQRPAATSPVAPEVLTVAVWAHPDDARRAEELVRFLRTAGVNVVDRADAPGLRGVVVFLSAAAVTDPAALTAIPLSARVVPVRVGRIDADRVPQPLAELNWLDWHADNLAATFGDILAALHSDLTRRDLSRQLAHEADTWVRANLRNELLIDDYRRARQMRDVLTEFSRDRMAQPSPATVQFVTRSFQVARRRQNRRRYRRAFGALLALAVAAAATVVVPQILVSRHNNFGAITTTGDRELMDSLPDWLAANSAALLVNGTAKERDLARVTLRDALNRPWSISFLGTFALVLDEVPINSGTQALVLYFNLDAHAGALALVDVRSLRMRWRIQLPGKYSGLAVSSVGNAAIVYGGSGAVGIDLKTRALTRLAPGLAVEGAAVTGSHSAVITTAASGGHQVAIVDLRSGAMSAARMYPAVLKVGIRPDGRPIALVRTAGSRLALVDVAAGGTIAATAAIPFTDGVGAISPDGRQGVVEASDGQLWTFSVGAPATPTGIPTPVLLNSLSWATGDRLALASDDFGAQVYYLRRAESLGVICRDITRLQEVRLGAGSDVVGCHGLEGSSFWDLPPGPRTRPPDMSTGGSASSATVDVRSRSSRSGGQLRISVAGLGTADWFTVIPGDVTAVAIGAGGTRVVVGGSRGDVAVVDLNSQQVVVVSDWRTPDRSPVTAVGWTDGPVATTASGQTWQAPDCGACDTDIGMINTFRARIAGCFTQRQLTGIDGATQKLLGLAVCPPPVRD